jgi:adenylate cyclase
MEFRIGVNLGDVIEEGERIYGDGVNIAARLESLSEAGGICISGTGFDQVKNKLSVGYQYLGKQTVKNIPDPVRAYKVLMGPEASGKVIGEKEPEETRWGWKAVVGVAVLALVVGGLVWNFYLRATRIEPASKEKMAFPLPEKPSIAVLPFVNMSGDKEQEYFSDGITEEIITALSKAPRLFVIARNSAFTYKGKAVKVKQVSEELGVRYVLEGSVRKASDKVRVTAQLIDALTGHHLWAERYDRNLKDIFALQDDITMKIITAVQVELTAGEWANVAAKGTNSLEAFMKYMQAIENLTRQTKEGNVAGRKLAEEAIVLDSKYSKGYIALALTHLLDIMIGTTGSPERSLVKASELLKKAIVLDASEPDGHSNLGIVYLMMRQYEKAQAEVELAVSLNPNHFGSLLRLVYVLNSTGRYEEAISVLKSARRLSPTPYQAYFVQLATAYRLTGQYKEAIAAAKEALKQTTNNILIHLQLTATYSMMGLEEEARAAAAEVMEINPRFSLESYAKTIYFKNKVDLTRTIDALHKAGLK